VTNHRRPIVAQQTMRQLREAGKLSRKTSMLATTLIIFLIGVAHAQCNVAGGVGVRITSSAGARALNAGDRVQVELTPAPGRQIARLQFTVDGQRVEIAANDQQGIGNIISLEAQYGSTGTVTLESAGAGTLTVREAVEAFTISAIATDEKGACGIGQAQFPTATPRDFVIAVGVSGIRTDKPQIPDDSRLSFSRSDAVEVSNHMVRYSGVPPEHAYLLLDDTTLAQPPAAGHILPVNQSSDISKIFAAVGRIADKKAHVYFYFSGHALVDPSAQGDTIFFLLPASDLSPGAESTRYTWSNLVNDFRRLRARAVLILDTCYSGLGGDVSHDTSSQASPNAPASQALKLGKAMYTRKVLGRPYQGEEPTREALPTNVLGIVTSSSGTAPSWEVGDPIDHGLFTYFLLQVGKEAVAATTVLTLDDAFGSKDNTNKARERTSSFFDGSTNPKQLPWASINSDGVNELWWVRQ
jgi:uncharacterized caspase-like protein